jgi:hypothetical protein
MVLIFAKVLPVYCSMHKNTDFSAIPKRGIAVDFGSFAT